MCNPLAMMSMSIVQKLQESDVLEAQRSQTRSNFQAAAQAEGVRKDQEALAIRMESDKIGREVKRATGTTVTEMAGAGVDIPILVDHWTQVESEMQGALGAKERLLAISGNLRMQEMVSKRDQLLSAQAGPSGMDYFLAAATGYMQGKMVQSQLSLDRTPEGLPIPYKSGEMSPLGKMENFFDNLITLNWNELF